jgi:hypothetical protein
MQQRIAALVGLAVVIFAVWMVARGFQAPKAIGKSAASAGSGASIEDGGWMYALGDGGPPVEAGLLLLGDLLDPAARSDAAVGTMLPDGSRVPPLPLTVPRQVRFGVILVSYAGAQPGAGGARPAPRSRQDARVLADKLVVTAQQDFRAAVQQGDMGSSEDVGQVKVGILEPAPEYVLFTLPVAAVAGPVETPRGYWIVKRLE